MTGLGSVRVPRLVFPRILPASRLLMCGQAQPTAAAPTFLSKMFIGLFSFNLKHRFRERQTGLPPTFSLPSKCPQQLRPVQLSTGLPRGQQGHGTLAVTSCVLGRVVPGSWAGRRGARTGSGHANTGCRCPRGGILRAVWGAHLNTPHPA